MVHAPIDGVRKTELLLARVGAYPKFFPSQAIPSIELLRRLVSRQGTPIVRREAWPQWPAAAPPARDDDQDAHGAIDKAVHGNPADEADMRSMVAELLVDSGETHGQRGPASRRLDA